MRRVKQFLAVAFSLTLPLAVLGQGTFQNLDFENGVFFPAPTPGNPFAVEWVLAMPGWTGFLGTNQQSAISHNALSLSLANITIQGPDYPSANLFHGQYYVVLQGGHDPNTGQGLIGSSIAQTGTIPATARSIQFYLAFGGMAVSFNGQSIPLSVLGSSPTGYNIYGGDILAFAGQTGELKFQGAGYLDYVQFSNQPIPEPSTLGLFSLALLLGYQPRLVTRSK